MPTVDWTLPARDDLRAISQWLEENANGEIAASMLLRIGERGRFLEDFPHGGRPFRHGTRILYVTGTSYLIRYRIIADTVQILRVHHERQNWSIDR